VRAGSRRYCTGESCESSQLRVPGAVGAPSVPSVFDVDFRIDGNAVISMRADTAGAPRAPSVVRDQ
jgi:hypothetical protein